MSKPKIATVWLGGCSGCHMSLLDLDERLVEMAKAATLTASPITDIKEPPEVDVVLVEGAVCNTENLAVLRKVRERAKILVAFGDCACFGNIPTMRNFFALEDVLQRGYVDTESTATGEVPRSAELPELLEKVQPLSYYVKVDANLPGCPPSAEAIWFAITELLAGRKPVAGGSLLRYD
ncbi:MAG: NADP oxidoreductase [Armatimonadetes bacterium]|nr:NADP oxidoreductase [Armatimonadota bacterium]